MDTVRRSLASKGVAFDVFPSNSLFEPGQVPKNLRTFTPFRKAVEKLPVRAPLTRPSALAAPPAGAAFPTPAFAPASVAAHKEFPLRGGSAAARERMHKWMGAGGRKVDDYKTTRNHLDNYDASSMLSAWLSTGCISAREVTYELMDYEDRHGANAGTQHLYFELLWREFFRWRTREQGSRLFQSHRKWNGSEKAWRAWRDGNTANELVNALMKQLVATGYMSNRGRQIAASALINEAGVDWRRGADWFDGNLIDADVGSNYGNWAYIAGEHGLDPRGGRRFNLAKQAKQFDPSGSFRRRWAPRGRLATAAR